MAHDEKAKALLANRQRWLGDLSLAPISAGAKETGFQLALHHLDARPESPRFGCNRRTLRRQFAELVDAGKLSLRYEKQKQERGAALRPSFELMLPGGGDLQPAFREGRDSVRSLKATMQPLRHRSVALGPKAAFGVRKPTTVFGASATFRSGATNDRLDVDYGHSLEPTITADRAPLRSFTREFEKGPRWLASERADLLRRFDATFATKVVPPNLAGLQSRRFAFVVSADLDNPGGH